jgi:hypothetical protein
VGEVSKWEAVDRKVHHPSPLPQDSSETFKASGINVTEDQMSLPRNCPSTGLYFFSVPLCAFLYNLAILSPRRWVIIKLQFE